MTLLDAPRWIQVALGGEALAVVWLTARFGWRGLGWSLAASAIFWFALGLVASFLVGRLEGGRAANLAGVVAGAGLATFRLARLAWPWLVVGALVGGGLRYLRAALKRGAPRAGGEPPSRA